MAIVRKYEKGDVESIVFNDIGKVEWKDDPDKSGLENGEAYTIIVGEYKCVMAVEYIDNSYFIWFTPDKRISPLYLKYAKQIIGKVAERGLPMFTLSKKAKYKQKCTSFLGASLLELKKAKQFGFMKKTSN